ncbi:MAG: MoaD/ThiS family protein [Dehalococcoidia bacterium]|nr:MoaD/ThiS family protein [Dehalococcoidia bacterium]
MQTLPITVKFYGVIRDVVDGPQLETQMPQDSTVTDLLNFLADRYGAPFVERVMTSQGGLKTYVRVFINNQEVDGNNLTRPLITEGQTTEAMVYVLPASTGG